MSNYSGTASFQFEIEREIDGEYQVIPLEIEGRSYFQSGKSYGPIENSYPDEGDTEITAVIGPDNQDWESKLTESEKDVIMEMIIDQSQEDYYNDY